MNNFLKNKFYLTKMVRARAYIEDLKDYIKKNLRKGYTKDSLKWALINQGNSRLEVEKAIKLVEVELASKAPVLKTKPEIKHEIINETYNPESFFKKMFRKLFGN